MSASSELVRRSGDLKGELVNFAQASRFARSFRQALRERFAGPAAVDEEQFINFLDWFVLQHRLPDGQMMVERFVAARPDLSDEERVMLLGWRDVVEGIFGVQRCDGEAVVTVNLVDELPYRVRSNMGPAVFSKMPRRSFLVARLVPIGDEWLLSGATSVLPAASSAEARRVAAEIAVRTRRWRSATRSGWRGAGSCSARTAAALSRSSARTSSSSRGLSWPAACGRTGSSGCVRLAMPREGRPLIGRGNASGLCLRCPTSVSCRPTFARRTRSACSTTR